MWERFDENARKAALFALDHAERLHLEDVCPDAFFLGCVEAADTEANRLLDSLGVSIEEALRLTEARIGKPASENSPPTEGISLGKRGTRTMDLAFEALAKTGGNRMGTVQILAGVISEGSSVFATIVRGRQILTIDPAQRILDLRKDPPASTPAPAPEADLSILLSKLHPLDALAALAVREAKERASSSDLVRLQAMQEDIDRVSAAFPARQATVPLAEVLAEAVQIAATRREPLLAAHLLAAMYRRPGSAVNLVAPLRYASVEDLLDRLVKKG